MSLVDSFQAARGAGGDAAGGVIDGAELERALEAAVRVGAEPEAYVTPERFVSYVAERAAKTAEAATLASLQLRDLHVACGCVDGIPAALRELDRVLVDECDRAFRRLRPRGVTVDDVGQLVRERLLVVEPGTRAPRLADYGGRGPLRVWLRVVVARLLTNVATRGPREATHEAELFDELPATTEDPELDAVRARYRVEFEQAFHEAVRSLPVRDRLLLHQRFVGKKSQDELARTYDVHTNTVARWLGRARAALEARIREELAQRLSVGEGEFTSILQMVRSRLDITLGALEPSG
jgi:RNA polymerase sigma-70 factor (ECF subfamily)